nr:hypothetical protein BaRGS_015754 [Batillaria attramentaria]
MQDGLSVFSHTLQVSSSLEKLKDRVPVRVFGHLTVHLPQLIIRQAVVGQNHEDIPLFVTEGFTQCPSTLVIVQTVVRKLLHNLPFSVFNG